uniref:Uncharacterized protein n=1 Tax=viral metagenome TaxID=1070528 RepID=A0A6C0DLS5_9ZZZZ
MSIYTHPDNQELLWNIINQNHYINTYFIQFPNQKKDFWFKTVIEAIYNKNSSPNITKDELYKMNQDTIFTMIQIIREKMAEVTKSTNNHTIFNNPITQIEPQFQSHIINTPPITPDNRQEVFNNQFTERQREYDSMLEKKAPVDVDFRDKIEDGVIQNMDELIKTHLQQREEELKIFAPPPIVPTKTDNPTMVIEPTVQKPISEPTINHDNMSILVSLQKMMFDLSNSITEIKNEILELKNKNISKQFENFQSTDNLIDFSSNESNAENITMVPDEN